SLATAGSANTAAAAAMTTENVGRCAFAMALLPVRRDCRGFSGACLSASRSGARLWLLGHRLEIRHDGVDLRRLELIFESGHARRAVRDHLPHHVGLSGERLPRERRAIKGAGHLWLLVTDAARLIEQA